MKFNEYLTEKSFSEKDLPKDFWVVFDIKEMLPELKTGKIKGLKGISSSSDIQFMFLGVARDAMLQIDTKQLLSLNKITRIMYDNPHYLVSKNMWALRRMYSAGSRWVNQVFGNLFERLRTEMKGTKHKQLFYDMEYYGFRNVDYKWSKKVKLNIKNIKDLANVINEYIHTIFSEQTGIKYDITAKELNDILYKSLLEIGRIYSSENEWVVKSSVLTLPKKTTVYILTQDVDKFNKKAYDLVKDNPKMDSMDFLGLFAENGVDKLYCDISLYRQMIKYDNIVKELGNKYTVKKISYVDFKKRQSNRWEAEKN